MLEYLSEGIGSTLREYGKQARTIGIRLRYVDHFSAHQTIRLTRPSNDERELLLNVWQALTAFMLLHMEKGWNQSVEPKTPKLQKAYSKKQRKSESSQDGSSTPKRDG